MRFAEFKKKIQSSSVCVQEDLDNMVHDVLSEEATAINNGGIDEQLSFLLKHYTQDELCAEFNVD